MKAPKKAPPRRVSVTIDRLVLRGFAPEERDRIAAGLAAELRRHLSQPAHLASYTNGRSDAVLRAAAIRPRAHARGLGAEAARTILAGIGGPAGIGRKG